ncbi:MAG: trypsin-like peptidase domain-containing protein [Herpetosiphon sp.]
MTSATNTPNNLYALSNQLADAVSNIAPSLVLVDARSRQAASGIVYAENVVLTADHVIEREEDIKIQTHDGRTLPAHFLGRDPATDIAVLQVPGLNLPSAAIAAEARVGQLALAVGRPGSDGPQASLGIVSAIGGPFRMGRGAVLERYFRTDATPYPGFSGGPLVDAAGAVLGMITTGLARGMTLAIPAAVALRVAETLSKQGKIKRGYLGISSQPVHVPDTQRAGRAEENGLLIMQVEPGAPAQHAGLLVGDILVALDSHTVQDPDELQALLTGDRVGKTVAVTVLRAGALLNLNISIGERT